MCIVGVIYSGRDFKISKYLFNSPLLYPYHKNNGPETSRLILPILLMKIILTNSKLD